MGAQDDRSRPSTSMVPEFGRHDSGEHLDQSRLAAAVFAGETDNLAGVDGEIDLVKRVNAGERLAHAAHAQQLSCRHRGLPEWGSGEPRRALITLFQRTRRQNGYLAMLSLVTSTQAWP